MKAREKEKKSGECVCVCVWRGVNVSTSQAETITSVGCLFLTHWANLIEAKHLKSSGNVADPAACSVHTNPSTNPLSFTAFYTLLSSHALFLKMTFQTSSLFSGRRKEDELTQKIIHLCFFKKPVLLSTGQQLCAFQNNNISRWLSSFVFIHFMCLIYAIQQHVLQWFSKQLKPLN